MTWPESVSALYPNPEVELVDMQSESWQPPPPIVTNTAGTLVSARSIELHGPWGHVFGPLDLDIDLGGVSVIAAQAGAVRTALLMALCGRMRLNAGSLTVLGNDKQTTVFAQSSIACVNELEEVRPSVTVRYLVTEQLRWGFPVVPDGAPGEGIRAGGIYPVPTTAKPFQCIHPFDPMTYTVNGLRQPTVAGHVDSRLRIAIAVLTGILLVTLTASAVSVRRNRRYTMERLYPPIEV